MDYTIDETRFYYGPLMKAYGNGTFGLAIISATVSNESKTVCKVICTRHGDVVVLWKDLYFKDKSDVNENVRKATDTLLGKYDEKKSTTYVAYLKEHAVRDAEYDIGYMSESMDSDSWTEYPGARIFIGLFTSNDENQARALAAQFAQTDVRNVEVLPVSSTT
ncbi:MAG: hypothetical protein HDQ88_08735 [Clostridia bacterium]|nr:hypothetical protein [Clostridia bacterium]